MNIFTENSTSWEISHTISLPHSIVNNFRFGYLNATAIQGDNPGTDFRRRCPGTDWRLHQPPSTMPLDIPVFRFKI